MLFHNGTSFKGSEQLAVNGDAFFVFQYEHPYIYYFICTCIFSLIAGSCSMMTQALSYIFKEYRMLYFISFIIWFFFILSKYSITYAIQPFIEYGLNRIIPAIVSWIMVSVCITIICYNIKVKKDEI